MNTKNYLVMIAITSIAVYVTCAKLGESTLIATVCPFSIKNDTDTPLWIVPIEQPTKKRAQKKPFMLRKGQTIIPLKSEESLKLSVTTFYIYKQPPNRSNRPIYQIVVDPLQCQPNYVMHYTHIQNNTVPFATIRNLRE